MLLVEQIQSALEQYINPVKREVLPRFFQTGVGQYAEGDRFLGITVPHIRTVAKQYKNVPLEDVQPLFQSPWHECRLCALLILVERFKKSAPLQKQQIFDLYLSQTAHINNWDLVDLSAPAIVGTHLLDKPRTALYILAESPQLWERRIAIVSTLTFIRHYDFTDTLRLAEYFLSQSERMHHLMQKATGWMLREMGKRDKSVLLCFLEVHAATMPRTMLRYAIEKLTPEERIYFMHR